MMPHRFGFVLEHSGIGDTLRWMRDSLEYDPELVPKALFTGLFIILGGLAEGIGSVMFWGVTIFWVADMVGGTARAVDRRETLEAGKAFSGILRYGVVMGAWVVSLVAQEMARDAWGFIGSVDWIVLSAGAGVFLGSFAGQVGYFVPPAGRALEVVADRLGFQAEDDTGGD
jgi:hypothetical protein